VVFRKIIVETSNEYLRLFNESKERFYWELNILDEEVNKFSDMLRYSKDNGKTFRKVDCLHGDVNNMEVDKLFSSSDLGSTFTKNDSTTQYYIGEIKEILSKRERYIKDHTKERCIYIILYDLDKNGLYSAENSPFIDRRSKDGIEQIRHLERDKKIQVIKSCLLALWGAIGSAASIYSIISK
jgi:hypothetical protein